MPHRILHPVFLKMCVVMCATACVVVLMSVAYAQQSHWATADDRKPRSS